MWMTQRQRTHYQSQFTKYNLYSQVCYSWDFRTNGLNNVLSEIPRTPCCLYTVIYDLDLGITTKYSKQHTSFYSIQVSFRFHSLRCSEILLSPSICTKIRTWRFHRIEEVSNYFSLSWHITRISMTISANLGRDTNHNSTKLVYDHPLHGVSFTELKIITTFHWIPVSKEILNCHVK